MSDVILEVKDLKKYFPIRSGVFQRTIGHVKAVDQISFTMKEEKPWGLSVSPVAEKAQPAGRLSGCTTRPRAMSCIMVGISISCP